MKKKLSESFQPEPLKSTNSKDMGKRQLTEREKLTVRRIAARQAAGEESVNLKLMPRLTARQLASMVRLRGARRER